MTTDLLKSADPAASFTEPGTSATAETMLRRILSTPHQEARARPARRFVVAGALAGAAAAALAVGGLTLRPDAPAAYAVSQQSDGDIVVTIHDLSDADGLEQALAEHGVTTEVTYDPEQLKSELENADETPPIAVGRPNVPGNSSALPSSLPTEQGGCPLFGVHVTPAEDGGVTFTLAEEYVGPATVLHVDISGAVDNFVGIFVTWENSTC
jgi:hypothetical protein